MFRIDSIALLLTVVLSLLFSTLKAQEQIENQTYLTFEPTLEELYTVSKITLEGNKQTKPWIILRELQFTKGDTISGKSLFTTLEKSRQDIRNISLFNFVEITATPAETEQQINIQIKVLERWYIWPWPILEVGDRNFNAWWETKQLDRLNYGVDLRFNNVRGRREEVDLILQMGYNQVYRFAYLKPNLNPSQTLGLYLSGGYSQSHEIHYSTDSTNRELFVKSEADFLKKNYFGVAEIRYRPSIYTMYGARIGYRDMEIGDTVFALNPNYTTGSESHVNYFSLSFWFKSDHRDYKHYPLKGYYFDFLAKQDGLGVIAKNKSHASQLKSEYRRYFQVAPKWYVASGLTGKISWPEDQAYFLQRSLGYERDFVRGYEYYVVDGQSFALLKSELKYELIKPQTKTVDFIKTTKFNTFHYAVYLNAFFDLGYVWAEGDLGPTELANTTLPGAGLGLDFVTYYDMIFRLEYSINKKGETGFYIHFRAPI